MGPDRSRGIVIQWDDDDNTGIIEDDYDDSPICIKLEDYALNRFSNSDYLFKPQLGEVVQYYILYYDNKANAEGVTNKQYWAFYKQWEKANSSARYYRIRFYISLSVSLILLFLIILLSWLVFA